MQWLLKKKKIIRVSDLLHFGVEVYVAVGNDELYGFICDVLVRRFHRNSPDKVHPSQIQSLHTLRKINHIYIFARLDIIFPISFTEKKQGISYQLCSLPFETVVTEVYILKEGLEEVKPCKTLMKPRENSHTHNTTSCNSTAWC